MKTHLKIIAVLALACLLIPCQVSAQKKTHKKTAARTVTYPQRDADFIPDYCMQPVGLFSLYDYNYDYTVLPRPDYKGHVLKRNMSRKQITLRQVSCRENEITDTEEWWERNNLRRDKHTFDKEPTPEIRPRFRIDTNGYSVVNYGPYWVEASKVVVADPQLQHMYRAYDFKDVLMPPGITTVCGIAGVESVRIEGNIMFASHQAYSDYNKGDDSKTGYLSAIDMRTGEILWTTVPKTCNSDIEIVGNSIICGYGSSFDRDFLYVVDKYSGQRVQKIPLKKAASHVVAKGNKVYVRTYSFDYVFSF